MSKILDSFAEQAPDWATHITADAHGYIRAWDRAPKKTPGGLFYSLGRSEILLRPGYSPEIVELQSRSNREEIGRNREELKNGSRGSLASR